MCKELNLFAIVCFVDLCNLPQFPLPIHEARFSIGRVIQSNRRVTIFAGIA